MMQTVLRVIFGLLLLAAPLLAQSNDPYKERPVGHEKNRKLSISVYEANLKKFKGDTNILVLPGLVADRQKQRVEVMVESTKLTPNAPCEFNVVGEASEHAYEALFISFARPSAIIKAIKFIGKNPAEPMYPAAYKFWSRGECFILSLIRSNEPPFRMEKMFTDQRTGKTLPEQGFRFTGSRRVPTPNNPQNEVYTADEYQPMAIVSLFNMPDSVFEVPYAAEQSEVYQNTLVNSEHPLMEGSVLTLLIEPVNRVEARPVKDLVLQVQSNPIAAPITANGLERLKNLAFQLKDSATVLNEHPTISSVLEAIAALDRKNIDYYLTVSFGDDVQLANAQALARILVIMDCDRGIRINPPPAGQLFYRAFFPDRALLDRNTRIYQPWELALAEKDGVVSGKLVCVDSGAADLEFHETLVSSPEALRKSLANEAERIAKSKKASHPPVVMVFAPAALKCGQLKKFLEPVLLTNKTIQVFVDDPMPPIPARKP